MSSGKTFTALEGIRYNGKRYAPGADIDLDAKAAKQLLDLNAVEAKAESEGNPGSGTGGGQELVLTGSSVLPAVITLAEGKEVQLGEVVAKACERAGLTAEEWNAQEAERIEELLAQEVELMKAEAVPANPPPTVEPTEPIERQKAIIEAIGKFNVDNRNLWLKDGRPEAGALSDVLGWQVSAKERDAAWAELKAKT